MKRKRVTKRKTKSNTRPKFVDIYGRLQYAGLIAEVYDVEANVKKYMITPKGIEWFEALSGIIPEISPKEKQSFMDKIKSSISEEKINSTSPHRWKKDTGKNINNKINTGMNKILDVMEGVAKFGNQIDKATGGIKKNGIDESLFSPPKPFGGFGVKKKNAKTKSY